MTTTAPDPATDPDPATTPSDTPATPPEPADRERRQPIPPASWAAIRGELGSLAHGGRLRFSAAVLLLALGAGAQLLVPVALGQLVDAAVDGRGTQALPGPAALAASAVLFGALASGAGLAIGARVLDTVLAGLRQRLVSRALKLRHTTRERAGTGDLVSRATADVAEVGDSIGTAFPAVTGAGFTLTLTVVGLGVLDPRYLLVLPLVLPIQLLAARAYLRRAPRVYTAERQAMADRATEVLDSLHGLQTVNAYRIEERRQRRITARSWQVVRHSVAARHVQNRFLTGVNVAEFTSLAAVLVAGFLLVRAGWGTVGETTTAVLFFLALAGPVGRLLFVIDDAQSAAASLTRIVGVIRHAPLDAQDSEELGTPHDADAPRAHTPRPDAASVEKPAAAVRLDAAHFAFPGREPVLTEVTLSLAPGERVAVVGTSGAGKSTLAALVSGLLRPAAGQVRVRGQAPYDLQTGARGRLVTLVTQEHHVFAGTLGEDLRLARPDADDQRLHDALRQVGASEWVSRLPDGLDTPVGESGIPLTAAREQQLALARVLLVDPYVVVLDEATAEADSHSSQELQYAVDAVTRDRTTLLVAHRLSQARTADRVVVLDAGQVREDGSHEELLRTGGLYTALWKAWETGR